MAPSPELMSQQSLNRQAQALKVLSDLPISDAIGICCSFLLQCVYTFPEQLRRVMNEKVNREGFTGVSLISLLVRVAR